VDALLIRAWLGPGEPAIPILDDASVALAREAVRTAGAEAGFGRTAIESAAVVASELARNQLAHARGGRVAIRRIERDGVAGLEIVAADRGSGIEDPPRALTDGTSTKGTLGVGLPAARRLAQEMDFDVRMGEGTCIWARLFASPVARAPEVAILGRPHPGEHVSGDQATFVREGATVTFAVVDGLGHGPLARAAADRAIETIRGCAATELTAIIARCDAALPGTRGAVLALGRVGPGEMQHVGVGNVVTRVERRTGSRSFTGSAFVLGGTRGSSRPVQLERAPLEPRDVVIAFTDGLTTRASLGDGVGIAHEPPLVIATWLLTRFARDNDDALVLVVK